MDKRDFLQIRSLVRAVWKGAIQSDDEIEAWYSTFKRYTYDQINNAVRLYIEKSSYEPKPADILVCIPKAKGNDGFNPEQKFETINGRRTRVYACQRCRDTGMFTFDDKDGCTYGIPCDCPAGHHYYRWGWLTTEEQQEYVAKHGHHGEIVGENWYELQPGVSHRS